MVASGKIDTQTAEQYNQSILKVESNWLNPDGIPGRPWFKHLLYCARYTYAHLELPGLTEAIESQNWEEAQRQSEILAKAIETNTALLQQMERRTSAINAAINVTAFFQPICLQLFIRRARNHRHDSQHNYTMRSH